MNFLAQSIGNIAGLCVGTAAVALGDPTGSKEAAIGAAGLIGFVLGQNAKFGPECARVRGRIQQEVMVGYGHLLAGSDGDADAQIELEEADTALSQHLGACIIDRTRLVQAALTPGGFPEQAVTLVMAELARKSPDLFAANSLAHRFASDVVRAGLRAVVENADYYRKLEPHLMLAMAQAIGGIDKKLDAVAATVGSLDTKINAVLQAMQRQAGHRLDDAVIADLRALLTDILGQGISDEQIPAALIDARKSLDKFRAELEHLRGLANAVPEIEPHLAAARAALDSRGQIDLAAAQTAIRAAREQYAAAISIQMVNLARLFEAEADIALARSDFLGAAELLAQAANGLPEREAEQKARLLSHQGEVLQTHGERFPGIESLRQAVSAHTAAGALCRKFQDTVNEAATQNNLGIALSMLGQRLGGTDGQFLLNQAIVAFEAALGVYAEIDNPTEWANSQNNLGNAHKILGNQLSDTAGQDHIQLAVEAFTAALKVHTQADRPLQWASTQNNIGTALRALGERLTGANGEKKLRQAVAAYTAALRVHTEADRPVDWATTQNNLGVALSALGEQLGDEAGLAYQQQGVAAFKAALKIRTETDMPARFAATQSNLGVVLQILGENLGAPYRDEIFREAVTAHQSALRIYTKAAMPAAWAMTQNNLGKALFSLGGDEGWQYLDQAVQAFKAALTVFTETAMPYYWDQTQKNLAAAEALLARWHAGEA